LEGLKRKIHPVLPFIKGGKISILNSRKTFWENIPPIFQRGGLEGLKNPPNPPFYCAFIRGRKNIVILTVMEGSA